MFSIRPWGKLTFGGKQSLVPELPTVFPETLISKKGEEKFYSENSLKNAAAHFSLDLQSSVN